MAMALFNDFADKNKLSVISDSAGIAADVGASASANSILVLDEIGVDLRYYESKQLNKQMLDEADLIVCMSQSHCDLLESIGYSSDLFGDGIDDPFGCSVDVYRSCRDKMLDEIPNVMRLLK